MLFQFIDLLICLLLLFFLFIDIFVLLSFVNSKIVFYCVNGFKNVSPAIFFIVSTSFIVVVNVCWSSEMFALAFVSLKMSFTWIVGFGNCVNSFKVIYLAISMVICFVKLKWSSCWIKIWLFFKNCCLLFCLTSLEFFLSSRDTLLGVLKVMVLCL